MNLFVPASLLLFAFAPAASALTTYTWDGGGPTDNFNNAANWSPDGVPANGDNLVFTTVAPDTVINDLTSRSFGSITFTAGTTVTGNAFTVTGGISTTAVGLRGSVVIEPNVTLGADQTFSCGGTGGLRFEGSVLFGPRALTVTGGSACNFNGLTGSSTAGSRLIKNGTGLMRVNTSAIALTSQPWDVNDGTLDVDGFLQTTVNLAGGKLTGEGSLTGLNATGGEIEPDDSGLSVSGNAVLGGTSRCLFHLIGPGDENTLECSGGSVTIQDTATMTVDSVGYTPAWDEDFQLITKSTAGALTGTFSNAGDDAEVTVAAGIISRAHYDGGNGNDLTIDVFSTIRTWDGGHTINDNWDEADNWSGNIAPHFGDALHFPAGIQSTDRGVDNNYANDTVFRELKFFDGDYTVRGNRLRLSRGFALQNLAASGQVNMDVDVALADDASILFPDAASGQSTTLHFDLLDKLDLAGHTLLMTGAGTMAGRITGSGQIQIVGGSNVAFTGDGAGTNDYSADTHIGIGARLRLEPNQKLGNTTGRTIISGSNSNHAVLQVSVTSFDLNFGFDEPVMLNQGELVCSGDDDLPNLTVNSTITLSGVGYVRQGNAHGPRFYELNGLIQGIAPVRFTGQWLFRGDSNNTFTGTTDVEKYGTDPTLLHLDRRNGARSLTGTALNIHDECKVVLLRDDQIAATAALTVNDGGELDLGSQHQALGSVRVEGSGKVSGTDSSQLDIAGPITAAATDLSPSITTPVRLTASSTLTASGDADMDLRFSRPVTRSGISTLTRAGLGVVEFSDTFNVPAFLQGGETRFNGTGGNVSSITLQGGTMRGRGSVDVINVFSSGGIAPGDETRGTLTCRRLVHQNGGANLRLRLSTTQGNDQLRVLESCDITGIDLDSPVSGVPAVGAVFTLIRNDGTQPIAGTFIGIQEGGALVIDLLDYRVSYQGGDGNDVTLTRTAPPTVTAKLTTVTFSRGTGPGGQDVVTLGGTATAGATFTLQTSPNLAAWTDLQPVSPAANGIISVTVNQAPGLTSRFFRLRP